MSVSHDMGCFATLALFLDVGYMWPAHRGTLEGAIDEPKSLSNM
jgi:hypothetical protein